jgi:hypothetical protein
MIERFFRDLTDKRIRRRIFQDLEQLIMAIGDYIGRHNQSPKHFIWTAKAKRHPGKGHPRTHRFA